MRKLTVLGLFFCAWSARAQETPQALLDHALRLGDKYSWADSRDLFFKAEEGFRSYDQRNALYAKIGRLRSTMEEQLLPALSAELDALLADETPSDAVPLACGVNTTLTVALCPTVTVSGNETPLRVNSEVLHPAEEIVTLAPVALNVALIVLFCPTMTLPKLRLAGETVN